MVLTIYQQSSNTSTISYVLTHCDLGYLLIAATDKGICSLKLGDRAEDLITILRNEFKPAEVIQDESIAQNWIKQILDFVVGNKTELDLPIDIQGTEFQKQVWQALQAIPYGETRTYQEIAQQIGKPKAARAIGNACGANVIALVIPCHRVVCSDGSLGGYRWGIARKQKLIAMEKKTRHLINLIKSNDVIR